MRYILAFAISIAAATAPAWAGHGGAAGTSCHGYMYLKGKKSTWPWWAKSDPCVKPWSENPVAKK